ncbi:futalosine hydrolase [Foetidibacter luteolus]|uniref:futalosine hydrolase n=1 Tax=Foetidibacter luteolus TaxID=2608880 RepID=UPI00129AE08D|nr:futalosine hydrolase [Foetidibacter luteolus]
MRVVITAATVGEWMPSFLAVNTLYTSDSTRFKLSFHQSGVGMLASSVAITRLVIEEKPDLVVQAGIAGCFNSKYPLGKVFAVSDETIGDMGVEEEGRWKDIFEMKLEKSSYPPYERRKLPNSHLGKYNLLKLPAVPAITVNQVTTGKERISQLTRKYNPTLESMEGAALHYVCRELNVPFLQLRAVSNYVGERNKENWEIKKAIDNLNEVLLKYIDKLYKLK